MIALAVWIAIGVALLCVAVKISHRVDILRSDLAKFVQSVAPDVFDDFAAKPHLFTHPSTLNIRYKHFDSWLDSPRLNKVPGMREQKSQYKKFRNQQRNLVTSLFTAWFLVFVWLTLYVA